MIVLSCGIKVSAVRYVVLSQCTRVTDGRTDRITTLKTALAYARAVTMTMSITLLLRNLHPFAFSNFQRLIFMSKHDPNLNPTLIATLAKSNSALTHTIAIACKINYTITKEGGNSDVLPLEAARRDSISKLTSCGASNLSCRKIQCRFIYSRCGTPR